MSAADRRRLYQHTLATVRDACPAAGTQGPELSAYCREQAELLTHFPECSGDEACRLVSERFLPAASR
jgi:hypothetical protein